MAQASPSVSGSLQWAWPGSWSKVPPYGPKQPPAALTTSDTEHGLDGVTGRAALSSSLPPTCRAQPRGPLDTRDKPGDRTGHG